MISIKFLNLILFQMFTRTSRTVGRKRPSKRKIKEWRWVLWWISQSSKMKNETEYDTLIYNIKMDKLKYFTNVSNSVSQKTWDVK